MVVALFLIGNICTFIFAYMLGFNSAVQTLQKELERLMKETKNKGEIK